MINQEDSLMKNLRSFFSFTLVIASEVDTSFTLGTILKWRDFRFVSLMSILLPTALQVGSVISTDLTHAEWYSSCASVIDFDCDDSCV